MEVIYVLLPLAVLLATAALIAFIRAASAGQFDDLETPPYRILFEDDATSTPRKADTPPASRAD
jgi:cbb3-type cytochrome oxidase maturation protein